MIRMQVPTSLPVLDPGPRIPAVTPSFKVGHRARRRAEPNAATAREAPSVRLGLVLASCLFSFLAGLAVIADSRPTDSNSTSGGP